MRVRRFLKRCTAAVVTAVMLSVGAGISVLDAHVVSSEAHFDGPSDQACSSPQHNHSLCEFLAATPVLAAAGGFPELARSREIALDPQAADVVLASASILRPNSRSPPLD